MGAMIPSAPLAAGGGISIDWAALGAVAGVSFLFGITIIVLFSVGVVGLSWYQGAPAGSEDGAPSAGAHRVAGATVATVCFTICVGAVLYGLWLLIPRFH